MKFYLLDDDKTITNILKIIITTRNLGEVCGISNHPYEALEDLKLITPDIVITDLLMPEMDGITFIKKAKQLYPDISFIMLSQVASKDMIANAYAEGIEFYIQKPLNSLEVEKVTTAVTQKIRMSRTLEQMQTIFQTNFQASTEIKPQEILPNYLPKLKKILQRLGVIGDVGAKDIITTVSYMIENQIHLDNITISELCKQFTNSPKSMEQRIRRTASTGMINLAHLGLEDYSNEIFTEYSNSLYNFEQIRKEMDFIRGKSIKHGNIKLKNFLQALCNTCLEQ